MRVEAAWEKAEETKKAALRKVKKTKEAWKKAKSFFYNTSSSTGRREISLERIM
jgi:hypothetical protein